jgi:hypothetical protein
MTTITFDTHKTITQLKQAGIPEPQAEAPTRAFQDVTTDAEVATKRDVERLDAKIADVRRDIREMEPRMTIKLGAMRGRRRRHHGRLGQDFLTGSAREGCANQRRPSVGFAQRGSSTNPWIWN